MPKQTASVLRRVHGNSGWVVADYQLKGGEFDFRILQAMAGGDCLFTSFRLNKDYAVICDEEGQLKALPVSMALKLANGTHLPIFGPFAVVRVRKTKKEGGSFEYVGLTTADFEIVPTGFPWVTM
jgi:hypothetical protein